MQLANIQKKYLRRTKKQSTKGNKLECTIGTVTTGFFQLFSFLASNFI